MPHELRRPLGRSLRTTAVLGLAAAPALLGGVLASASADTPRAWEEPPATSPLGFLLVLLIIPLGLFIVITLLALLPSLAKDKGYEPGQAWRGESEWFGGPTQGLAAADQVGPAELESASRETGGTSGRW